MSNWTDVELAAMAAGDDLHIAPLRADGRTPGTPTWIWSVVVDGALYVRAYNGTASRWHQAALAQGAGQIRVGAVTFDVTFTPIAEESVNAEIDAAYRAKYAASPYLPPMIGARARAATVRIDRV